MEKIRGIVLGTIKHSDRSDITTLYTLQRGRMAVASPAGGTKTARLRRSSMLPMSVVEFEVSGAAGREIERSRQITPLALWRDIYFNPVKSAIAMFMAEFLQHLLRENAPDAKMWNYIVESTQVLDGMTNSHNIANFHIAFLSALTSFAGIAPDISEFTPDAIFDLRAGAYTRLTPVHRDILTGSDAIWPMYLSRMNYINCGCFRLRREDRNTILHQILRYYTIHFPGTGNLRSPEILSQLFA